MLKCHNTLTQTQLSTNESVSTISVIYYESCDYCLYSVSVTEFSVCYPNFFFKFNSALQYDFYPFK